jgi:hypothetical protein
MRDDNQNGEIEQPSTPEDNVEPAEQEYPVDRLRQRFNQSLGGRPVIVYLVLFAGAATLLLLLAIVWISATGDGSGNRPICTPITAQEAQQAIMSGQVQRINVLVDQKDPLHSLTGMVLELGDSSCRQPQQGADYRNDLYFILGVADFYNSFGDQRVRIHYQRQNVAQDLLSTSTPTPQPTLPPTETPTAQPVPTETPTLTPEPTATPTQEPSPPATETLPAVPIVTSPAASPKATPGNEASANPGVTPFP